MQKWRGAHCGAEQRSVPGLLSRIVPAGQIGAKLILRFPAQPGGQTCEGPPTDFIPAIDLLRRVFDRQFDRGEPVLAPIVGVWP